MRWWGWGEDRAEQPLAPAATELLRSQLGVSGELTSPPPALADVTLPTPVLSDSARSEFAGVVGADAVRDDAEARIGHAAGRGYVDLVRLRGARLDHAPDAVVAPADATQVRAVLARATAAGIAVVPFGGGTSVVGGVEPMRGTHSAVIALDLTRLDALFEIDARSLTATVGAGIFGPALESGLAAQGLTLGHFPQSFEYSTVGGWLAARSAGQASTGNGRIDELAEAVVCETPAGTLSTLDVPGSAAGPSLRELVIGSEGTLGAITAATLRVRPAPTVRHYEGWAFRSFAEGLDAMRRLRQAGIAPDVARLSDESETRLTLATAEADSVASRLGRRYLRARGRAEGCLAIAGFEGGSEVARRRGACVELLRAAGGLALGRGPGEAWRRGRFEAPYIRDDLLGRGVMVETLETATTWSRLQTLHREVSAALTEALAARGTPALVTCHVSHLYSTGASLYFTFFARQELGAELDQWTAAKLAASEAIATAGATISHHHGIGRDHLPWMGREVGELGVGILNAVKDRVDPTGVMNPGKLIPAL